MHVAAIALDFDGTLIESADIKDSGWERLFASYPPEVVEKVMVHHRSDPHQSRFEKFRTITQDILGETYTSEREQLLNEQYSQLVFDAIVSCPEVVGCRELLNAFFARVPLYIVTVNPEEFFKRVLTARGLPSAYFAAMYTTPWTKADALADILRRECCDPASLVYVGDDPEDAEVAKKLGTTFVGRDSGRFPRQCDFPVYGDLHGVAQHLERV